MTRLPDDYKLKESNGGPYFKPTEEPQEFRILTSPIVGYEYFAIDDDRYVPVRSQKPFDGIPGDSKDGSLPKEFRAFVIYNHTLGRIQIMEITQQSIKKEILKYIHDSENWGDPKKYDFRLSRSGKGKETRYSLTALPKSKFESEELFQSVSKEAQTIKLSALFEGGDPFKPF